MNVQECRGNKRISTVQPSGLGVYSHYCETLFRLIPWLFLSQLERENEPAIEKKAWLTQASPSKSNGLGAIQGM